MITLGTEEITKELIESWLDDSFLEPFKGKQPQWGYEGLGYIVELRTYARKKEDGTLEDWWETVYRVTVGNYTTLINGEIDKTVTKEEVQQFFFMVFNLIITPPGRGLWMSGTEYSKRSGDAMNNCWGTVMRPHPYQEGEEPKVSFAPVFTFDQAMKGGGVGAAVQKQYVDLIPMVQNKVNLKFVCRTSHPDKESLKKLSGDKNFPIKVRFLKESTIEKMYAKKLGYFKTPDSREGWGTSLGHTIDFHYEGKKELIIDISDVREEGALIKSFGGVASGPMALVEMLAKVNFIINRRVGDFLTPTEWADVIQLIGTCVVAGNVRRTALIIIGDQEDQEFIESKNYSLDKNRLASQWRWASNNSVDVGPDTDRTALNGMAVNIFYNGEPGYINKFLAQNYGRIIDGFKQNIDGKVAVFNPCGEVPLEPEENCNLFEVNLPRIEQLIKEGKADESLYEIAFEMATRYTYRITFRYYEWESTREVVARNRRLGVAITGITDWFLLKFGGKVVLGFDENNDAIYKQEAVDYLDWFYSIVKQTNEAHAQALGTNPSLKLTTVKPSGTISILMGVSPGQHFHWSKYMIRRVRLSAKSELVGALLDSGYKVEPAQKGYNEDGSINYDYTTVVAEFPIKAPTADYDEFQSAKEVSLKEQAAIQALLAKHWADNAVSATLSFHKPQPEPLYHADGTPLMDKDGKPVMMANPADEWAVIEEITDILDKYKNVIKSTSMLPHDTGTYPQMPLEEITEEKYRQMKARITGKPWELITGNVQAFDEVEDSGIECTGGGCPTK